MTEDSHSQIFSLEKWKLLSTQKPVYTARMACLWWCLRPRLASLKCLHMTQMPEDWKHLAVSSPIYLACELGYVKDYLEETIVRAPSNGHSIGVSRERAFQENQVAAVWPSLTSSQKSHSVTSPTFYGWIQVTKAISDSRWEELGPTSWRGCGKSTRQNMCNWRYGCLYLWKMCSATGNKEINLCINLNSHRL